MKLYVITPTNECVTGCAIITGTSRKEALSLYISENPLNSILYHRGSCEIHMMKSVTYRGAEFKLIDNLYLTKT